ncbi:MAG: archaemetzincin family Zn-dependent metalloprotease [Promethearchaeota archaeon]
MRTGPLRIFGFEKTPREILVRLTHECREWFQHHFEGYTIHPEVLAAPEGSYVKDRGQYKAYPFLETIGRLVSHKTHALGLVDLDLFVPDLNFIFGTAQFGGNAIVALPRLRQSFYGLPDNDSLFFQRTVKEVVHELGHVLGLRHCTNHCVMRFSNSLADTDNKPDTYCQDCLRRLE